MLAQIDWALYSELLTPHGEYVAPSWSWASHPSNIVWVYDSVDGGNPQYEAQVVEAWCSPADGNKFGAVSGGALTLRARNCPAHIEVPAYKRGDEGLWRKSVMVTLEHCAASPEMMTRSGAFGTNRPLDYAVQSVSDRTGGVDALQRVERRERKDAATQEQVSGQVHLVWLTSTRYLILADSRKSVGAFERLGTGESPAPVEELCPGLERSAITIV